MLSASDEIATAMPTSTEVYSLTVTDGSTQPGCSPNIVYTTSVTVRPTPSASPTNNGYICVGGTVDLAANPANGASVFTWSGSALSSVTDENPSATCCYRRIFAHSAMAADNPAVVHLLFTLHPLPCILHRQQTLRRTVLFMLAAL